MKDDEAVRYRCEANPDSSSWVTWHLADRSQFNGLFGDLATRRDGDRAIVRLQPHRGLINSDEFIHGGALMTFIDMSLFVGARVLGCIGAEAGVTVDLSVQFAGGADARSPIDAIVQITRETGRLAFLRGTVEQEGEMISSFLGIIRKRSR